MKTRLLHILLFLVMIVPLAWGDDVGALPEISTFTSTSSMLQWKGESYSTSSVSYSTPSFSYDLGCDGLFLSSKRKVKKNGLMGNGFGGGNFSSVSISRGVMSTQGVGGGSTTYTTSSSIRTVGRPSGPPIGGEEEAPLPISFGFIAILACFYAAGIYHRRNTSNS